MTTTAPPETVASSEPSFEELAGRVDSAMKAVAELDPPARATAEELKAAVEAVHRAGLVTIVRSMRSDTSARELLFELVDDPAVHMLLSLHGIVRPDPVTMANKVLVEVRPRLQSHGGDVSLARVEDGVAYVRPGDDGGGGRFAAADTANNRILLWDKIPVGGHAADHVPGQPTFVANGENRWSSVQRDTMCWPYGLALHGNLLAVADSGNNRVVIWWRE